MMTEATGALEPSVLVLLGVGLLGLMALKKWVQGRTEGFEKGMVIGEILLAQRILKLTLFTQEELEQKNLDDLNRIFTSLETQLLPD